MSKTEKDMIKTLINQFRLPAKQVLADWLSLTTRYSEPLTDKQALKFLEFCYWEDSNGHT